MSLADRIPATPLKEPSEILDRFLAWVADCGLELYPAQQEALLELMAERHVCLSTPTGSGKSLVALGLHFKALCEGRRSFYTSPIKALASEKFFALCEELGAERVGMLTGDASINSTAPVICCTAEVLSNMALRQGARLDAPYVVMDEFHYYADRDRGVAWQIPLLEMPHTTFLMMSATLGDPSRIQRSLEQRSGREVSWVHSEDRPVPLDWEYAETPLHETVERLLQDGKAPVYVVHFTQRECAERAQGLTSARLCSREERRRIQKAIEDADFSSPYGREFSRFLRAGIGLHHAGLLPRYRLLVEQLAQQGMLKVICGTDTLGVGVNIPIRTVLFSSLSKFDGEKVTLLGVREFKQIAGRAGRKGFDERGSVVCQAPEHRIEARRVARRRAETGRRGRAARKRPPRGQVPWSRDVFEKLIHRPCEPLTSSFSLNPGILMSVLQRPQDGTGEEGGYRALLALIRRCHEGERRRGRMRREAAVLFRALRRSGVIELIAEPGRAGRRVRASGGLQADFSLHQTLSLYLVEALDVLVPDAPDYALSVLSLVEAVLEDPRAIQAQQVARIKRELLAQLKAERVPYEERVRLLEEVTPPRPEAEFIYQTFEIFAEQHPWVGTENIRPKSIAREIFGGYHSFASYVREYGLARMEGLLLRYLGQVYDTLARSVPEAARTPEVYEVLAFFRTLLTRTDASLIEEWESLLNPELRPESPEVPAQPFDLAAHPKLLAAEVRADLHRLLSHLARRDYASAAECLVLDGEDPWDASRLEAVLAPYFEDYGEILFTPAARRHRYTLLQRKGPRRWEAQQVIVDPRGDEQWCVYVEIDLTNQADPEGPLLRLLRIGT
ncbi:MAG: DEAD/DEAH box helicase [Myxococcota bacterium]